ncbi:hypothetical protein RhiirA4_484376 [Rhizophagus irregularis]|uniref:Uncharacterized protein n=1 Tax=Rhizophagus irregularis TaxID=588596 RepID=A0A2I1HNT1_9GLOM|nr:hypothetical protein RhiirA4_484376 [Rhizophagus irregularis]
MTKIGMEVKVMTEINMGVEVMTKIGMEAKMMIKIGIGAEMMTENGMGVKMIIEFGMKVKNDDGRKVEDINTHHDTVSGKTNCLWHINFYFRKHASAIKLTQLSDYHNHQRNSEIIDLALKNLKLPYAILSKIEHYTVSGKDGQWSYSVRLGPVQAGPGLCRTGPWS